MIKFILLHNQFLDALKYIYYVGYTSVEHILLS